MPPVVAALVPAALSYATGATIGGLSILTTSLVVAGTNLAAYGIQSLTAPKPRSQSQVVSPIEVSAGDDSDRKWLYGKSAIQIALGSGGPVKYWETTGTDNKFLWFVIALHDTPMTAIDDFIVNNTSITFTSNAAQNVFNFSGTPYMWRWDKLGDEAQTVETNLDAASTKWTSAHRGRGVAYCVLKLEHNNYIYPQGLPSPIFVCRGRKLWDPRLDNGYGGSGSHLLADETTWAYSNNAALCLLDYLKGVKIAAEFIGGCRVPIAGFDVASFQAAATICDENVALKAGGTEKRYTINGWVSSLEDKGPCVQAMLKAMGGMLSLRNGKIYLQVAAARTSVLFPASLTDDDMAGPIRVQPLQSRQDKINTITSVYPEPTANYSIVSAPVLSVSSYVTADGGATLSREDHHRFTTSVATVQRLNKLAIADSREQLGLEGPYKPKAIGISAGDAFAWYSASSGYSNQKMLCLKRRKLEDGSISVIARQETDAKYSWSESTEEVTPPTFNTNAYTVLPPAPATPTGLTITPSAWTVTISWNQVASPYLSGYDVLIGPQGLGIGSATLYEKDRRAISYTTAEIAAGNYAAFVRARDIYGQEGSAVSANFTITGTVTTAQIGTGQVTSDKLGAAAVIGTKLALGVGANMLWGVVPGTNPNRYMIQGNNPDAITYTVGTYGVFLSADSAPFGTGLSDSYTTPDFGTYAVYQPNADGAQTGKADFYLARLIELDGTKSQYYEVETGKTYEFSAYTGAHRCKVVLVIAWYNSSLTYLSETAEVAACTNDAASVGGTKLADYARIVARGAAPANAAYALLVCRKYHTKDGQTDSWMTLNRPMFSEAVANATEIVPWNAPGFGLLHGENLVVASLKAGTAEIGFINAGNIIVNNILVTGHLTANAATLVAYASGSDVSSLINDANWHDLVSITYTSEGYPILTTSTVLIRNDDSGTHGIYIRLMRDGVGRIWPQTADTDGSFQLRQSDGQTIVVTLAEDLSAGSVTYRLQYLKADSVNVKCLHPLIQAAEIKR